MTQAGIPVPPGFVLLASAFEAFLVETDIGVEIAAALDAVNTAEMHTVERASEKIQGLILQASMPQEIQAEILASFKKLGAKYVAVRSSATAEDSSSAAWAGQLDSFLNTTEESLLANIQKCWASLYTPRAIFYGFENGFHGGNQQTLSSKQETENRDQKTANRELQAGGSGEGFPPKAGPPPRFARASARRVAERIKDQGLISVAVVVQAMVQSEISGIAFSVHPVTEDPNQLIIEAGYGLGEAVVSGQITPDSYVVTKSPLEILDKNISTQERMLVRSATGGNEWVAVHEYTNNSNPSNTVSVQSTDQKLTDVQILELSRLIIKIENHYGFPCDIEWAFITDPEPGRGGQFYITQSRPITTLTLGSDSAV
jgi:pyruvate,water dikinase